MSDIEKAAAEALAIAKGESPAARIYHNGHFYVPQAEVERLRAELEQCQNTLYRQIGLTIQASEDATKASAAEIERLRALKVSNSDTLSKDDVSEIERLRAALDKMKRSRERYRLAWEAEKARAALGEKP